MKAAKIAQYALLIALALVLSYVEALVPLSLAVPGIKLGLPNLVIVFALYRLSPRDACIISVLRIVMVSVMFGNAFSMIYSLSGAVLSLTAMILLRKIGRLSLVGVSVAGGVFHNLGQILCAMLLLETARIVYYLPVLLISGTVAGVAVGAVSGLLVEHVGIKSKG